jgi:hypothetical protein
MGDSQLGQVPLHQTRQGPMPPPPPINLGWLDASPHRGREENIPVETQICSLGTLGPLDGAPDAAATGCPLCHIIPRSGCPRQL